LILLFVAYQLWGTTLYTNQQQSQLGDEFEARLASVDTAEPTTSPGAALPADEPSLTPLGAAAEPTSEPLLLGQGVARIEIPKINADYTVVEGTDRESLKNGPGHYPETPLPGETGNAAIAGHRTTYGAPFYRLDELQPGDEIKTQTLKGSFTYIVTEKTIVNPDATDVLEPKGDNRLTLTTCHPKYSAAKRLIITAQLQETSSDQISEYQARELPKGYDESQNGQLSSEGDGEVMGFHPPTSETYAWGFVLLLVGIGWWYEFRRKHSLSTWMAGFVPFFVVLFFFYGGVEEMLPPGF
jgi:sortase A